MTDPEQPAPGLEPIPQQVEALLASSEVAKAIESDQFKRFLDHIPIAIAVSKLIDGQQRLEYANPAFEKLCGYAFAQIDGKGWSFLSGFTDEDDPQRCLDRAVEDAGDFLGVFRRELVDVDTTLVQAYSSLIENDDSTENYRLVALVDLSKRERAQRDELERKIRDKDLLLREIQHRVKNNLQLIVGLIRLEAREVRLGEAVDLDRLAGRIECLKSLYQTLSELSSNEVDLGHYLGQIASAVIRTHGDDQIRLALKCDFCPVSINVAMPAGLAVNELLTNALKYAFEGRGGGTVTVECLREDDRYRVLVADDGVGLPANTVWPTPGSLGALIVQSLRENPNLDLKVETASGSGTRMSFTFLPKASAGKPN
jgi:PAS domain S-box-containing protein